ncbi:MAG: PAS domain-containing protein, partial [Gammaproteobacteria bacterium]|nr:PAS domain-containing protein [Gammaproteobacteria bacterium]
GDRLHEGLYLLDAEGRLQYANPAALQILGVLRESQIRGRDPAALFRRIREEADDRRYGILDDEGRLAANLGVIVRRGAARPAGRAQLRLQAKARNQEFEVQGAEVLDFDCAALGCVAVRVVADAAASDEAVRDLAHVMTRVTRPEDLVVRTDTDTVSVFAQSNTLAGVKAIAERLTARGRREIAAEFRVGIALGGPGDSAATLLAAAQSCVYSTKPRLRGPVAVRRSGCA